MIRPASTTSCYAPPHKVKAGEGLCPHLGRTHTGRQADELLKIRISLAPLVSDCHRPAPKSLPLPTLHTFPSTADNSCCIDRGHTGSWFPQNSPDTPWLGVRSEYFLTPVPAFLEPIEKLQRLGAVQRGAFESSKIIHSIFPSFS